LLYYARESWFVRTTAYKEEMLSRNARVNWHPEEIGTGRFGEWLRNNVDWAISRDRYWGTPLPLWVCDFNPEHVEAVGSFAELAEKTGRPLKADFDPHKPYVDEHLWNCSKCDLGGEWRGARGERYEAQAPGGEDQSHSPLTPRPASRAPRMHRVSEVIDAWFDSGSMPFAQWHYPFENRELMAAQYPADFIAEGVDQTRGWFYSLLAIATGLGDELPNNQGRGASDEGREAQSAAPATESTSEALPRRSLAAHPSPLAPQTAPYRAVVVNDLVLDATGVKMSKSRGNVVEPWEVLSRHGADAVRLFLVASSQLDLPRRFDESAIRDTAGRFLLTLRNVYSGIFAQYANFGWHPSADDPAAPDRPVVDRWILSRTRTVEREVDHLLGTWDATAAARLVMSFVVDDVSNWYVRLNRARLYQIESDSNRAAFATLHEVLTVTTRLLAPFAPFISDFIHRELTGESVHLATFVRDRAFPSNPELESSMDVVRELARLGRAAREEAGIGIRWPLHRMLCVVPDGRIESIRLLLPLLATELNVKEATILTSADELVELTARPNFRSLGKRFGKDTPLAAKAVESLGLDSLRAFERGEPVAITVQGQSHVLELEDVNILRRAAGELVVRESMGLFAAIDPRLTDTLRREGIARELVNRVQRLRKEAGLAVSDRILLRLNGAEEIERAGREYKEWIAGEVLAREILVGSDGNGEGTGERSGGVEYAAQTVEIDGLPVRVALTMEK
jgi:isoleucyl-tRNA synthetase